jgi:hypothetical protein
MAVGQVEDAVVGIALAPRMVVLAQHHGTAVLEGACDRREVAQADAVLPHLLVGQAAARRQHPQLTLGQAQHRSQVVGDQLLQRIERATEHLRQVLRLAGQARQVLQVAGRIVDRGHGGSLSGDVADNEISVMKRNIVVWRNDYSVVFQRMPGRFHISNYTTTR